MLTSPTLCCHGAPMDSGCPQCVLTLEVARLKSLNSQLEERVATLANRSPAIIDAPKVGPHPFTFAWRHSLRIPDGPHAVIIGTYLGPRLPHDSS